MVSILHKVLECIVEKASVHEKLDVNKPYQIIPEEVLQWW